MLNGIAYLRELVPVVFAGLFVPVVLLAVVLLPFVVFVVLLLLFAPLVVPLFAVLLLLFAPFVVLLFAVPFVVPFVVLFVVLLWFVPVVLFATLLFLSDPVELFVPDVLLFLSAPLVTLLTLPLFVMSFLSMGLSFEPHAVSMEMARTQANMERSFFVFFIILFPPLF